tara:strand:- start:30430 stop:30705 length:276 start_codon:yes stop_codon:yes gene_type:complete
MWKFFEWAWNLPWGEGFALLAVLFVFWYGKKWIDNRFSGMNNRSKREMKALVREAMDEWADGVTYLTPNKGEGRYYCSKPDCEGVKFSGEN